MDLALLDERTATKRQNNLLVPFGRVFPRKLIQFLEDFDRSEANRSLFTPATNIMEEGGTFLLLSEKNGGDERLSDELIRLGARPVILQYSLH